MFATNQAMTDGQQKNPLFDSTLTTPILSYRPRSEEVQTARTVIPAHILAEAISKSRSPELRWSNPATPIECRYAERYIVAKYPQYASLVIGGTIDFSTLCINENVNSVAESELTGISTKQASFASTLFFGRNPPELDNTMLKPSRLLDVLTKKSSFPGTFISIPEIQARNKVMETFGLPSDEYIVVFASNYKDAMMLVGESYPFFKGNFYMTTMGKEVDHIREFASYNESKVFVAPLAWLDLRIEGSQLSQYLRRKCRHKPKGLFAYSVKVNDSPDVIHWIAEAHRYLWHVLLDASDFVVQKDRLILGFYRPDFLLCTLDNKHTHSQASNITCLLIRFKSFSYNVSTQIKL